MVTCIDTPPCVVHELTRASRPTLDGLPGFEVRRLALDAASARLRMRIADLGTVAQARAMADVARCPVCRSHRPPAA